MRWKIGHVDADGAAEPDRPSRTAWAHGRPILTLVLLATVVPELVSGSTPVVAFLNPGVFIFLLLGYGLPVLLIRELTARRASGLAGLIGMGLAYGVLNEGLFAKTFLLHSKLPVAQYDNYGYWFGISFPWAAGIGTWHALASVSFPILLTHYFFPEVARAPWLKGKTAVALGLLLLLLACAGFLGKSKTGVQGTPGQLAILLALMLTGLSVGAALKGRIVIAPVCTAVRPVLLGASIIVPFLGLSSIAAAKLAPVVFFGALVAVGVLYDRLLRRRGWLSVPGFLYFGVGWYLQNVLVSLVVIATGNPLLAFLTAIVDALLVYGLLRTIGSAGRTSQLAAQDPASPLPV